MYGNHIITYDGKYVYIPNSRRSGQCSYLLTRDFGHSAFTFLYSNQNIKMIIGESTIILSRTGTVNIILSFRANEPLSPWVLCPGGHSAHTRTGGQSEKFPRNQKISVRLHCNPKISANFKTLTLVNKHARPEKMPTQATTASTERRNISLSMLYAQKP